MDCLLALRQGCKEEDEAEKFNSFLRKIAQNKTILYCRQVRMEEERTKKSINEYKETVKELMKMGKGSSLKLTHRLVVSWHDQLLATIKTEIKRYKDEMPGLDRTVRNYATIVVIG